MRLWPRRQGSSLDLLVVGLGNPGREYARNRHNVGHMVVDELARRHDGSWRSKFSGQLAEIRLDGHKLALLKPETYMNESGQSVGAAARFFKLDPDARTAWAPREQNAGHEWLAVDFAQAVDVAEVRIRETFNPGAISKVTGVVNGQELVLWEGNATGGAAPRDFVVPVQTIRATGVYRQPKRIRLQR